MVSRTALLASLLILVGSAAPAMDIRGVIAAAPSAGSYPGADAVVLRREVAFTADDAGRLTRREHVVTRLQSQWAMRNLADVRVAWDSDRQDLSILTCRTFMADGREVASPPNAFNEVTPDAVDRAVPFLSVREMVISHVATEVNAVLDLEYEIRDREPGALPLWGEVFLQDRWPVREIEVSIAPSSLAASLVNGENLAGSTAESNGVRSWSFHDLPALPAQGSESRRGDFAPYVVFAASRSWDEVSGSLRAAGDHATAELGPALTAWLAGGDDLTRLDTLQRIAKLCHEGVRVVQLPAGTWSRAPRPVAEVYATAVATPWEQALLTQALLRAAGLEPEIGFFTRWQEPSHDVAAIGQLGDLRVVAASDGENWWFAPSRSSAWSGNGDLTGRTGLFLDNSGGSRIWKVPAGEGSCRLAVRIEQAKDGKELKTTADLDLSGALRDGRGEATTVAADLAKLLVAGGEEVETTVRNDTPARLALRVVGKGPLPEVDPAGLAFISLPMPRQSLLDHLPSGFHAEEPARTAPLFVETTLREETTVTLALLPGQKIDSLPEPRTMNCAGGTYVLTVEMTDDCLVLHRTLELRSGVRSQAEYPELRTLLAEALRQDTEPIVLLVD